MTPYSTDPRINDLADRIFAQKDKERAEQEFASAALRAVRAGATPERLNALVEAAFYETTGQ